jgi:transcription initiation factor TFIIIB Brf1 subunit/transcription initiation factor TFIIB
MARTTPCSDAKKSLRNIATAAVECNCCGMWVKERRTNAHRELQLFAVNEDTRKAVRL